MIHWTDLTPNQKADVVRDGCAAGLSARKIGEPYKASKNSVISVARRRGISMPHTNTGPRVERRVHKARARVARLSVAPSLRAARPALAIHDLPAPETWAAHRAPISLLDLTDDTCCWPVGEAGGSKQMFCGDTVVRKGYCACHAKMRGR